MYFRQMNKYRSSIVTAGCFLLLVLDFSAANEYANPLPLVIGLLLILGIHLAWDRPLMGTAVFLPSFVAMSLVPDFQLLTFIFFGAVFLGVVAFSGLRALIGFSAVVLALCGAYDSHEGAPVTNAVPVVVWCAILGGSALIGWAFFLKRRSNQRLLRTQETKLIEQRAVLATSLHDTAVSQLTSVVMKAESTAAKHRDDPALVQDLAVISDAGRQALSQLRGLIDVLRGQETELLAGENDRVFDRYFRSRLEGQGFEVQADVPQWNQVTTLNRPDWSSLFRIVLNEAATNIIKYGAPDSAVHVSCECPSAEDGNYRLSIVNRVSAHRSGSLGEEMSTGMGIETLDKQARILGAEISTESAGGQWLLHFTFPASHERPHTVDT